MCIWVPKLKLVIKDVNKFGQSRENVNTAKVHSFLKQCFAQSSVDTIWWYLQLMTAEASLIISWRYHQIMSFEGLAKLCFKSEPTLVTTQMAFVITNFNFWIQFGQFDFHPWKGQNFFRLNVQEKKEIFYCWKKDRAGGTQLPGGLFGKNYPSKFYCIFIWDWYATKNFRGGFCSSKNTIFSNDPFRWKNGILLPKLFWPTVRKNCYSDRKNFLRSLEQFIQTVISQNNFW